MTTSGKPIHIALGQSLSEQGYQGAKRMPEAGVHLTQQAINNGLDARMILAYTADTEPDAGGPDVVPGYEAETEYYPAGIEGPRIQCRVEPVWRMEYEKEPSLAAFRTTVMVDEELVGSAYVEITAG